MTALDELERSLARAVNAGAAAEPDHTPRRRQRRAVLRRRRGWHALLSVFAACGVATGALAATGNLPVLQVSDSSSNPNYAVMSIPGMDTRAKAAPTVLPMRIADPTGGPPWALRTFPIGRGRLCAQAGQIYRGRFGVVTQIVDRVAAPSASGPAPAKTVFQELPTATAIMGVRCGTTRPGEQLIAAGRSTTLVNPDGTDMRCRNSPPPLEVAPCPITAATVVRWGFLGDRAKTATFVHPGGRRGPTQQLTPATGGAYLFVEAVDPAPFRASQRFERELRRRLERRLRAAREQPANAKAGRGTERWNAEAIRVSRAMMTAARTQRRSNWRAQQAEAVDATFEGAPPRRVAGPGAKGGPLPGVAPVATPIPKVSHSPITARFRGPDRAVEIRFRSPVALDARPGQYSISVRGPQDGRCGRAYSHRADYAKETAAGDEILVRVRPMAAAPGRRLPAWCPGARYDVRVRHVVLNVNKPGLRSEQLVGTTRFTAR